MAASLAPDPVTRQWTIAAYAYLSAFVLSSVALIVGLVALIRRRSGRDPRTAFLSALQAHWKSQNIAPAEAASEEEIAAFEHEFGVRLPADFTSYLRSLNGMQLGHYGAMDNEMISFWRLKDIREDRIERPLTRTDLYAFADWSVDCCTYAIQLSADAQASAPVFIISGTPLQVADSFAEFVEAYLRNDERALYAKGI